MKPANYFLALLRIVLGWMFLWAFADKLFGLGFATESAQSWLHGGSPTAGFLKFATAGPFEGFYHSLAGQAWVDWMFMVGLALLGLALILGIGLRVAAVGGSLLLLLMYTAALPKENNPVVDEHIVYILLVILFPLLQAGHTLGLGKQWSALPLVQKNHWLE